MKNKSLETYLYSAVGVAAMALLLIGLNLVLSAAKVRVDLTKERVHTLSNGTRAILQGLDTDVRIRFYASRVENPVAESVFLMNYARQVDDLLDAIRRESRGRVKVERFDPRPDSDAEDSARLDGIEGQPMPPYGESFFLGMTISQLDQRVSIPFLSPSRERLLEYDIARAIASVSQAERPVVGVMSALPVFGMPANPMMAQMGRPQGQEPWVFLSELRRDFTVREVESTVDTIDEDIQVMVVIYPKDISEMAQYALDQFVLRGGRLLAFLDPLSFADSQSGMMNPLQQASASGATLDRLLRAWGLEFDLSKCVSDMTYKAMLSRGGRPEEAPAVLMLTQNAMNQDDPVTGQLDNLLLPYAGVFTGTPAEGLEKTVLLRTSADSMLIDKIMAQFGGGADKDFRPSGIEFPLAVRLDGRFRTAFPNGRPNGADDDDPTAHAAAESLKESVVNTSVVLVGDSDLLFDPVAAQIQRFLGQRIVIPQNGNLSFGQSLVELLAGDSNLIAVRSRASLNRPFTVVRELEARAQENYRSRIRDLENQLQETQTRLNELQRGRQDAQHFILSEEQQRELASFRQMESEARRDLKVLRRNLRQEVDALQNRLTWINIALMPLLITVSGIGIALFKRKKTAAQ
jgi:ABC-type uncharacterized transport system involved in gliding motility auxiliary subunit